MAEISGFIMIDNMDFNGEISNMPCPDDFFRSPLLAEREDSIKQRLLTSSNERGSPTSL